MWTEQNLASRLEVLLQKKNSYRKPASSVYKATKQNHLILSIQVKDSIAI